MGANMAQKWLIVKPSVAQPETAGNQRKSA
jgi:hypothetical protein